MVYCVLHASVPAMWLVGGTVYISECNLNKYGGGGIPCLHRNPRVHNEVLGATPVPQHASMDLPGIEPGSPQGEAGD